MLALESGSCGHVRRLRGSIDALDEAIAHRSRPTSGHAMSRVAVRWSSCQDVWSDSRNQRHRCNSDLRPFYELGAAAETV